MISFVVLAVLLPSLTSGEEPPIEQRREWMKRHAVALRSIETADEDFADLARPAHAIGKARVVVLGEPSHATATQSSPAVNEIAAGELRC